MKKKEIILVSIIIILVISLIGTIIYYNKNEKLITEAEVLATGSNYLLVATTNNEDYVVNTKNSKSYQIGDKLKIELTNINKKKTPYEASAKNIILIENQKDNQVLDGQNSNIIENTDNNNITSNEVTTNQESNNSNNNENKEITNSNNTNNQTKEENYTEEQVITYFENLNNELTTYNNDKTLGETIKTNFVKCIDFLFYNEPIGGKTFSELTNSAKIKILEISLSIDSKIDSKFPGYKESINSKYQNIKSKIVEKYLDTTTTICTNDPNLCITAKEGFQDLKNNFGLTWDVIKNLVGTGASKLKDWYEIWRYN